MTERLIISIFAHDCISDDNTVKDSSPRLSVISFLYCDLLCSIRFMSVTNEHQQNKIQSMHFKIRCIR